MFGEWSYSSIYRKMTVCIMLTGTLKKKDYKTITLKKTVRSLIIIFY